MRAVRRAGEAGPTLPRLAFPDSLARSHTASLPFKTAEVILAAVSPAQLKPPSRYAKGLNPRRRQFTFLPMRLGRAFRLVLLALPLVMGLAAGSEPPAPLPLVGGPVISPPRESLPPPVHNEATCAFCQAAIFSPCAPQPTNISVESTALVCLERPAPQAATPHSTSHRPTSSRGPPPLRIA